MSIPRTIKITGFEQPIKYFDNIFINNFYDIKKYSFYEKKYNIKKIINSKIYELIYNYNNIVCHIYFNIFFLNWNDYYYKNMGYLNYYNYNNTFIKILEISFKIDNFNNINLTNNDKKEILSIYNFLVKNFLNKNKFNIIRINIIDSKINLLNYINHFNKLIGNNYKEFIYNKYINYIKKEYNIINLLKGIKRIINNWVFYNIKFI